MIGFYDMDKLGGCATGLSRELAHLFVCIFVGEFQKKKVTRIPNKDQY